MAWPSNEPEDAYTISSDQLRQFVEQIERLAEEEANLRDQKNDVYKEAQSNGYDKKVLRDLIARRKKDKDALEEHEAILRIYEEALGF